MFTTSLTTWKSLSMSRTTTFQFTVEGDNYEELTLRAANTITRFMSSAEDEEFEDDKLDYSSGPRVNYELLVSTNEDIASEYQYKADVVARIRD